MKGVVTIFFSALLLVGCREQVVHNLSESEANRVISGLHSVTIASEKHSQSDGLWTVEVDRQDLLPSLQFLETSKVLRSRDEKKREKTSLLSSREEQRFQHERALSNEIEQTIAAIDGVRTARVHLNLPPIDPIFGQPLARVPGSASVLLSVMSAASISSSEIGSIVSGASGIAIERIAVVIIEESNSEANTETSSYARGLMAKNAQESLVHTVSYILVAMLGISGLGLIWWVLAGRKGSRSLDGFQAIRAKG